MKLQNRNRGRGDWRRKLLQVLNLRPEEGERTFVMFAFYTATSVGLLWLEQTTVALFLAPYPQGFGAKWLPVIYIASAAMGSGLGFLYSWLQKILPLQKALLAIALLITLPLFLFRLGLSFEVGVLSLVTVFVMRLWLDADEILIDLNTQVAANQLFNIREIKRTYPLISSGLLLGDVIAGFSLPVLLLTIGLKNTILAAAMMMLVGGGLLFYLTQRYHQVFPNTPILQLDDLAGDYAVSRPTGVLKRYLTPLFAFFILAEVLYLLVEFQYLKQLEINLETAAIAGFLGLFSGVLGIFELLTQWFVSSRAMERFGVFRAAMFLPIWLAILGVAMLIFDINLESLIFSSTQVLFWGAIALRFFDELLRYTLIAGIEPFLFQPIPAEIRGAVQAKVQGMAEPIATGVTGAAILGAIALIESFYSGRSIEFLARVQGGVLIVAIIIFSICWAISAWLLRSTYVSLLVEEAEQGRLGFQDFDIQAFKRAVVEKLEQKNTEADKRSCLQILERLDPAQAAEVVAPLLTNLSPTLQRQSLEVMLKFPNPAYRSDVERLIERKPNLDVLILALRYVWLSQPDLEVRSLKPYLNKRVDPVVRGTAASLILRQGTSSEKAEATNTLETMLTSSQERERAIGVQALQEADYAQLTQIYIPKFLKDESSRVRRVLMEVITIRRLEPFYPSLIKGLSYKSTREAAKKALVSLGNEAIPVLVEVTEDIRQSDFMHLQSWNVLAEIATEDSLEVMVQQLITSWGVSRRNLLRVLLKVPNEAGIEAVIDSLGRSFVETAINQELLLLGQVYSAMLDLTSNDISGQEADLLRSALADSQTDIFERCFLLMRLFYPANAIQAARLNLKSASQSNIAMGLEILDNVLDIPRKAEILIVLDRVSIEEKLSALEKIVPYQSMKPRDRVRRLLTFRHFLSDWLLACCFHLAKSSHWSLTQEAILMSLRHPKGFVREAVLAYLQQASPRTCQELLPVLKNDPDPIVAAQVNAMTQAST